MAVMNGISDDFQQKHGLIVNRNTIAYGIIAIYIYREKKSIR
jgi:hypothetical protein